LECLPRLITVTQAKVDDLHVFVLI
jgi:hypothetical protein